MQSWLRRERNSTDLLVLEQPRGAAEAIKGEDNGPKAGRRRCSVMSGCPNYSQLVSAAHLTHSWRPFPQSTIHFGDNITKPHFQSALALDKASASLPFQPHSPPAGHQVQCQVQGCRHRRRCKPSSIRATTKWLSQVSSSQTWEGRCRPRPQAALEAVHGTVL